MEDAFIGCSVTEDANTNLFTFLQLQGKSHTDCLRNTPAYNSIRAQIIGLKISDVHRTTASVVVTGVLAKEFRHHQIDVSALGNEMSVTAMMIDQVIIGMYRQADAGRH